MLVHEPRGHSNMYASLLVPPAVEEADMGVLYLEPGGYVTMCGHGTIAICTVLIGTGMIKAREPETDIALDTPKDDDLILEGAGQKVVIDSISLPFLSNTEVFLFPCAAIAVLYVVMLVGYPFGFGWNFFGTADFPFRPFHPESSI